MQQHIFIGRQDEIDSLYTLYHDSTGNLPQFVLVGGVSGVGKSSLIEQFLVRKLTENDTFIIGKYDENKTTIPYQGISEAIRNYARSLSKLTKANKTAYASELGSLLYPNLSVLLDIAPEFTDITGPIESAQVLTPLESNNRFLLVIVNLFKFILSKHNRVVLYLDDLHWADKESIRLIESLLLASELNRLFIIGTYRVEEVGISHPLSTAIRKLFNNTNIHRIDLQPLHKMDIHSIINKRLLTTNPPELTEYLFEKSGGNPLYLGELIDTISENKYLANAGVTLDTAQDYKKLKVSKNVVDLLILKLTKMSPQAQDILQKASCIGTTFHYDTLLYICNFDQNIIDDAITESLDNGILRKVLTESDNKQYRFEHDRVRESAYEMIKDKPNLHLDLGRLFLNSQSNPSINTVDIENTIYHLNKGAQLITDAGEKISVCSLNLSTALTAKHSGAYSSAIDKLQTARALLPIDGWVNHHDLTYNIYKNLSECYYLDGNFEKAEELCHLTLTQVSEQTEQLSMYSLKVTQLTNLGKWQAALDEGFKGLKLSSINLEEGIESSITDTINNMSPQEYLELPVNSNPTARSTMVLLNTLVSPIYVLRPELLPNLVMHFLRFSIQDGNSIETAYAYDMHGLMLGPIKGEYHKANEFAQVALTLNQQFNDISQRCKIKLTYSTNISPWVNHIKYGFDLLEQGAIDGLNAGDIINSGYCNISHTLQRLSSGDNLGELSNFIDEKWPFISRTQNPARSLITITKQLILNLQGNTRRHSSFTNSDFDENNFLLELRNNGFLHGIHWFHVNKMLLAIIDNDYTNIEEYIAGSQEGIPGSVGQFSVADHNFYHSLILSRQLCENQHKHQDSLNTIIENQKQLHIWAENCPDNFLHKYKLVQAEINMLDNSLELAEELYISSQELAIKKGFIHDAAIATERFAYAIEKNSDLTRAKKLQHDAVRLYSEWGATRKVSV